MSHTAKETRDIELLLLGTLLHRPKDIYQITDMLHPEHFCNPDIRIGFEVARDLAVQGKLDMVSFSSENLKHGDMWPPEAVALLSDIFTKSGYVTIGVLAHEIRSKSIIRKAVDVSKRISVCKSVEEIHLLSTELSESLDMTHKRPFYLSWDNPEKFVEDLFSSKVRDNVTPTGFFPLDEMIVGLSPGELMVFGAVSGTGKTTFAMDIAWNIAKSKPVAFISVEMGEDQLKSSFYSTISGVEPESIKRGIISPFEKSAFDRAVKEMEKRKLILDFHSHELDETILRIRRLVSEHKTSVVIVDYCQQIHVIGKKNESREREVSKIVEALKRVAMQTGCAVILLSQISREGEKLEEPEIWHLRESGVLGQAADYVLLAWRQIGESCTANFKLAKNRPMTRLGRFSILFHTKRMTYRPVESFVQQKVLTPSEGEKVDYTDADGLSEYDDGGGMDQYDPDKAIDDSEIPF